MQDNITKDWLRFTPFSIEVNHILTPSALRAVLRLRKDNGATSFVRKIGGTLYMSPTLFYQWIENGSDN